MLRQIFTITLQNAATLHSRLGSSLLVIVGSAGVVLVFTALSAMTNGLQETIESTGEPDRVLILAKGSRSEINGAITRDQAAIIAGLPGIATEAALTHGKTPVLSAELYTTANLPRKDGGQRAGLALRGVSAAAFVVRSEIRVTQGRAIQPGRFELLIGAGAAGTFAGLNVGDHLSIKGTTFKVVGHFASGGRATESEAWLDVDVMANVFKRGANLNTLLARLEGPESLSLLEAGIEGDRRLANSLYRESEFHAEQSAAAVQLMKIVGTTVSIIMAIGAIATALNALYVAVSARTREIAILRALGFPGMPILVSVLFEAMILSLIGGSIGTLAGWLLFDGTQMSSMGAAYSPVAFRFVVDPLLLLNGISLSLLIGFFGGLFPACRAVNVGLLEGLRSSR